MILGAKFDIFLHVVYDLMVYYFLTHLFRSLFHHDLSAVDDIEALDRLCYTLASKVEILAVGLSVMVHRADACDIVEGAGQLTGW